ncbi:MAG: hypothetical protein HYW22_00740 [Candidatus Aenigmarchaeota archaeon]|nr:hypothetical protein [Candidatus Aenigmarchaeota archaeon]
MKLVDRLFDVGKIVLISAVACSPTQSIPSPQNTPVRTNAPTVAPTPIRTVAPTPTSTPLIIAPRTQSPIPSPTANLTFSLVDYGLTSHFSLGIRVRNSSVSPYHLKLENVL